MRYGERASRIAGIAALALLLALLTAVKRSEAPEPEASIREKTRIELTFEPELLSYDGSGKLDLLEGVHAQTEDGEDLSGEVEAVLISTGTENEKRIRYSVFAGDGSRAAAVRTLKLTGYAGPALSVEEGLEISAEKLDGLTGYLAGEGLLRAEDGFGNDVSDKVTWYREKLGTGAYRLTFTLTNDYLDTVSVSVRAKLSGEPGDIELLLSDSSIVLSQGAEFYPMDYVVSALDPDYGEIRSRLTVSGTVDTLTPGNYTLIYTLTSLDNTQKAEAALLVKVTEGNYD